ncbi:MAG: ribose 5-phosphate isomerase B [Planctomycetota bacterium]
MSPSRDAIRDAVRRQVEERLRAATPSVAAAPPARPQPRPPAAPPATRSQSNRAAAVITDADIERLVRNGESLDFPVGTRFTPLAQESLERAQRSKTAQPTAAAPAAGARDAIAIGADHGGFPLKEQLAAHLRERGFAVIDCGTDSTESCDYPVIARAVGEQVRAGTASAGIVVDGAGIGSAMTVNKMRGVRAAHCHNTIEARNARDHNHAHVLTMGSGFVGFQMAAAIVDTFLSTPFGGDRHARRVALIEQPEDGARR